MKPLVSICIPTYNGAQYLQEALDSVKQQSYTNLEVIVSDDSSKDNTLAIIEHFKNTISFPVYIHHHKPKGIGANWNNCLEHAKGEYIKFLFQDDVLLPECVEVMVRILEKYPNVGIVGCQRSFIVDSDIANDEFVKKWVKLYDDLYKYLNIKNRNGLTFLDKNFLKTEKFLKWPLNKIGEPTTIMFKKEIIERVGRFREDLIQILDYEFYYRTLKKYNICLINESLCEFRIHPNQATQINRGKERKDYKKFNEIIRKEFFWYINKKEKLKILRSNYRLIDLIFRVKGRLKL